MSLINNYNGQFGFQHFIQYQYPSQRQPTNFGDGTRFPFQLPMQQIFRYWFAPQTISIDINLNFNFNNGDVQSFGTVDFTSNPVPYSVEFIGIPSAQRTYGIGFLNGRFMAKNDISTKTPIIDDRILNGEGIVNTWFGSSTITQKIGDQPAVEMPNQTWGFSVVFFGDCPVIPDLNQNPWFPFYITFEFDEWYGAWSNNTNILQTPFKSSAQLILDGLGPTSIYFDKFSQGVGETFTLGGTINVTTSDS